jgi:PST family polysaccharide transporter
VIERKTAALRRLAKHRVVRNALALYGIQAANYILPWITFPYLTRVLGAEKFGLLGVAQAFIQYFVVVTEYGFNFTATRDISICRDDADRVSRIFTSVMIAKTLLMLACFVAMMTIVFAVPQLRADLPLYLISFTAVVGNVLFPQWLFQGLEEMGYITAREIGARVIGLLPTFLLVHGPGDYLMAAFIQSGSVALAGLAGLILMPKVTAVRFTRVRWREIRDTYTGGFHIFISTAAITLYTRGNTFLLKFIASERETGYFVLAQRFIEPAKSLVMPISIALFPHISHLSAKRPHEAIAFLRKYAVRLCLPFAALSLGIVVLAPLAIRLGGGPKYAGAVPMLQWMAPIPFILSFSTLYATQFMLGLGYKKQWARMILLGGGLNFLVLFPLLRVVSPGIAVSITGTAVELWVSVRSWIFYRAHRDLPQPAPVE